MYVDVYNIWYYLDKFVIRAWHLFQWSILSLMLIQYMWIQAWRFLWDPLCESCQYQAEYWKWIYHASEKAITIYNMLAVVDTGNLSVILISFIFSHHPWNSTINIYMIQFLFRISAMYTSSYRSFQFLEKPKCNEEGFIVSRSFLKCKQSNTKLNLN